MSLLDRYIGVTLLRQFAFALAALLAVFTVINLTEELRLADTATYGVAQALNFILRTGPAEACRLLPAAALLGAVMGLGQLQSHNELVAMQAAGVSLWRVLRAVLLPALLIAAGGAGVAELVGGPLSQQAHRQRALALTDYRLVPTLTGMWVRDQDRFVNIGLVHPDGSLVDVSIYDFDGRDLRRITVARAATLRADGWVLSDVHESVLGEAGVAVRQLDEQPWDVPVDPRRLETTWLRPEDISIAELQQTIQTLRRQRQNPLSYEVAFWRKVSAPFYAVVMVLLAVPIVVSGQRTLRVGERVVAGALVGLGFQMFQQIFTSLGLVSAFPAAVTALTPAALALAIMLLLLWRHAGR